VYSMLRSDRVDFPLSAANIAVVVSSEAPAFVP
jgi:hypothetical protein